MNTDNCKFSKSEFLSYLDKTDEQAIAKLQMEINEEFHKKPEDINWERVTQCMQAITQLRIK